MIPLAPLTLRLGGIIPGKIKVKVASWEVTFLLLEEFALRRRERRQRTLITRVGPIK
jgi:hypothetical protein